MTIREISSQLLHIAIDGRINGEKFSKAGLERYISTMFRGGDLKLGNAIAMEINLRDGHWLFTVERFSNEADGFDYYIPDTREQEDRIWKRLTA